VPRTIFSHGLVFVCTGYDGPAESRAANVRRIRQIVEHDLHYLVFVAVRRNTDAFRQRARRASRRIRLAIRAVGGSRWRRYADSEGE